MTPTLPPAWQALLKDELQKPYWCSLEQRLGAPLKLYSGYSDSKQDNPLLFFCEHRWRVSKQGELQQLE